MSNQINLDLLADTSQAQKAISDLTRDVDKLQKKAANTEFKGSRGEQRGNANYTQNNKTKGIQDNRKVVDSSSALKSAFGSLASQIAGLSSGLSNAVTQMSTFTDVIVKAAVAIKGVEAAARLQAKASKAQRRKSRSDMAEESAKRIDARATKKIDSAKRLINAPLPYGPHKAHTADPTTLRNAQVKRNIASAAEDIGLAYRIRQTNDRLNTYGPATHSFSDRGRPITPTQRMRQGWLQAARGGQVPGASFYRYPGGRMAGVGNMARGALGFIPQSFKSVGAGVAGGLAAGTGALGRGVMAVGRGIGALGSGAMAALSNPYVAGAVGGAAIAAAPVVAAGLYANHQVDKGRQKAEDLTHLETQFKNLSKNIAGVEVDALSKDLQKLAIEGAVPVQELSKGASMLMLAFKGNQKETSKWTEILADMSAGTGQSVDYFAELITKANQFGTVEFEVFNQLNEKGIPIIDQLKGKFGDTREEIMKAAQEGKITAAEFMKAFEAAHKVSMEGANARKAAASRMDIQKQTQEYEELEAANVTRGYDAAQMEYDKARRDRAKRRSEDEHVIATSEALGDALGDLVEVCRTVGDGISDAFGWAMHGIADMMGWDDDHANAAMDKIVQSTNNLWYDALDEKATSQGVESSLLQIQRDKERLSKIASNDEFDDDVRKRAKDYEEYLAGIIETLEKKAAELAKKEARAQEIARQKAEQQARYESRQRASESYKKYKLDNAKTEEELLKLNGESSLSKVENKIKWIEGRLESGYADESEFAELERLVALRDEIIKLREAIKKDAEEKQKLAEEERKAAERKAAEEKKLAAQREDYLLAAKVNRNENDYASKYELQYNRTADRMKSLGFSEAEIRKELALDKKSDLSDARKRLKENNEKIKQEEENIKNSKMTGKEGIENAWGSVGRVITSFTSPYEQNSLKELKDINKNLKSEINAIKAIDTKSKAQ
jgi:colicin import membrane protein